MTHLRLLFGKMILKFLSQKVAEVLIQGCLKLFETFQLYAARVCKM